MNRSILSVLIGIFLSTALHASAIEDADYYFMNRHKDASYLSKSKNLCEEALEENSSNVDALWRMSRVYAAYGYYAKEKSQKLALYEKAKEYAELAKKADPNSADAYHWYGISLSRIIQTKGLISAISLGMEVKSSFEKAIELDSRHFIAMCALGIWYYEAPKVAGGDIDKTILWLKKGLSVNPHYTLQYIYLAKAYIKQNKYEAARTQLETCLGITDPFSPADFYTQDKPNAKTLLAEIEGK